MNQSSPKIKSKKTERTLGPVERAEKNPALKWKKKCKRKPITCSNDIRAQLEIRMYGVILPLSMPYSECSCVFVCELSRYFLLPVYLLLFIGIECTVGSQSNGVFQRKKFKWFFWWHAPYHTNTHTHASCVSIKLRIVCLLCGTIFVLISRRRKKHTQHFEFEVNSLLFFLIMLYLLDHFICMMFNQ